MLVQTCFDPLTRVSAAQRIQWQCVQVEFGVPPSSHCNCQCVESRTAFMDSRDLLMRRFWPKIHDGCLAALAVVVKHGFSDDA